MCPVASVRMGPHSSDVDRPPALFVPHGDGYIPTDLSRGPWSPDALHGGPVAALLTRAVEQQATDDGLQLARVTVELLRPVPMAPLTVATSLVRPGRKVQLVDVVAESGDVEVAWARALRIRRRDDDPPVAPTVPEDRPPPPMEEGVTTASEVDGYRAFHNQGMDIRFVKGRFDTLGPATAWFRLRCPVVAGEDPSPWQRAVAAADFGNGIAAELSFGSHVFINPDLTVSLYRPPVGEWVCLDARTRFGTSGIGGAESALWDADGRIGSATQSLLVEAVR